jgi:hypothetical protein
MIVVAYSPLIALCDGSLVRPSPPSLMVTKAPTRCRAETGDLHATTRAGHGGRRPNLPM